MTSLRRARLFSLRAGHTLTFFQRALRVIAVEIGVRRPNLRSAFAGVFGHGTEADHTVATGRFAGFSGEMPCRGTVLSEISLAVLEPFQRSRTADNQGAFSAEADAAGVP